MRKKYLFDTHALIFWSTKEWVDDKFINFFDDQANQGNLLVSSISFWEAALLSKKKRIKIRDILEWKTGLVENSGVILIDPTATEMITSTLLPGHHKDPFDRLLIVQSNNHKAALITRDKLIKKYKVDTFWI